MAYIQGGYCSHTGSFFAAIDTDWASSPPFGVRIWSHALNDGASAVESGLAPSADSIEKSASYGLFI